jgi:hypothetical protein
VYITSRPGNWASAQKTVQIDFCVRTEQDSGTICCLRKAAIMFVIQNFVCRGPSASDVSFRVKGGSRYWDEYYLHWFNLESQMSKKLRRQENETQRKLGISLLRKASFKRKQADKHEI